MRGWWWYVVGFVWDSRNEGEGGTYVLIAPRGCRKYSLLACFPVHLSLNFVRHSFQREGNGNEKGNFGCRSRIQLSCFSTVPGQSWYEGIFCHQESSKPFILMKTRPTTQTTLLSAWRVSSPNHINPLGLTCHLTPRPHWPPFILKV